MTTLPHPANFWHRFIFLQLDFTENPVDPTSQKFSSPRRSLDLSYMSDEAFGKVWRDQNLLLFVSVIDIVVFPGARQVDEYGVYSVFVFQRKYVIRVSLTVRDRLNFITDLSIMLWVSLIIE